MFPPCGYSSIQPPPYCIHGKIFSFPSTHTQNRIFAESDKTGDKGLDLQEFKDAMRRLDRKLKSLPATAQVADQQGKYVARLLNKTNGEVTSDCVEELEKKSLKPFEYKHLGSFAYIGDNKAVLELPIVGQLCVCESFVCVCMCVCVVCVCCMCVCVCVCVCVVFAKVVIMNNHLIFIL